MGSRCPMGRARRTSTRQISHGSGMPVRDRQRIAQFLTEYAIPTLQDLPALCAEFRAPQVDVDRLSLITRSGAQSLARLAQRLPELGKLDGLLPDFDLADEILEAKLSLLEKLYRRWREAWGDFVDAANRAGGAMGRHLRNMSEALLKGLNAFLGSLKDALSTDLGLGPEAIAAHVAKEAKEVGEAALAATKR